MLEEPKHNFCTYLWKYEGGIFLNYEWIMLQHWEHYKENL